MYKIIFTILLATTTITYSFGQVAFNFEAWLAPQRAAPFDWTEPENWTSTNRLTEFINPGVTQTSDAYEGSSAVLISSLQIFGTTTASSLVLGNGSYDFKTKTISLDRAGLPLDQRLAKVSAWYKYENSDNTGTGRVEIIISRWKPNENNRSILAYETASLPLSNSYKQIEINLPLDDFEPQMDSITLVFHSEKNTNPTLGTGKLYVDDVRFGFLSNTNNLQDLQTYIIHPNPVSKNGMLYIIDDRKEIKKIRLYNINGNPVLEKKEDNIKEISLADTQTIASGIYFLKLYSENHVITKKIIIH